jgi:hypothetical protein
MQQSPRRPRREPLPTKDLCLDCNKVVETCFICGACRECHTADYLWRTWPPGFGPLDEAPRAE